MNTERIAEIEAWKIDVGAHLSPEVGACIMEAVSYVAGEPWSDHPACACPVISSLLRSWNDGITDEATRTRLLRPLVPRIVGSKSTPAVELRRSYLAIDWLARVQTPAWLEAAGLTDEGALLRELDELHDAASCRAATDGVRGAQRSAAAAWAAAWAAAGAAAEAAARDAARDALAPTVATLQASALELVDRMLAMNGKSEVQCWGCECGVPVRNGLHEEETDMPGVVYVYPCASLLRDVVGVRTAQCSAGSHT